jgi:hypothetical protein
MTNTSGTPIEMTPSSDKKVSASLVPAHHVAPAIFPDDSGLVIAQRQLKYRDQRYGRFSHRAGVSIAVSDALLDHNGARRGGLPTKARSLAPFLLCAANKTFFPFPPAGRRPRNFFLF